MKPVIGNMYDKVLYSAAKHGWVKIVFEEKQSAGTLTTNPFFEFIVFRKGILL